MKAILISSVTLSLAILAGGCSGKSKNNLNKENQKKNVAIDVTYLDTTINPADDFFEYANKKWIEKNPIPASKSSWGMFSFMDENSMKVLKDIQEKASKESAAAGSNTQIIGDFYSTGMD